MGLEALPDLGDSFPAGSRPSSRRTRIDMRGPSSSSLPMHICAWGTCDDLSFPQKFWLRIDSYVRERVTSRLCGK